MIKKCIPEPIKEKYRRIRAGLLSLDLPKEGVFPQPEEELKASADMSVIVPIHDSPELTARCLGSLERYAGRAEVILVDDGSRLEETRNVIADFQQRNCWRVIRQDEPVRHSRACEAGARLSTRQYLCFLNSDTVITPWSWYGAKDAFESDSTIAVTGPSTSWASSKQIIRRAEYCRNYWTDNQIYAFAKKYILKQRPMSWVDLPAVGGFAFFIRRSVWTQFRGFDSRLPDYGNESELCKRLSQSGFRIVWTKNSYIHHFGEGSYGRIMNRATIKEKRLAARDYIKKIH